jgi:L-asparaginase
MPSTSIGSTLHTVVLGTGGTIAGTAASGTSQTGYTSAQLGVQGLVDAVPALSGVPLRLRQLAQCDSKDMSHALWQLLVREVAAELARDDVGGIVITHGTDTLEETAYLLQRVLAPAKPVVLTAAMRPATSLQADGPQNLLDAVTLAREQGAHGAMVLLAGRAHAAVGVRKVDAWQLDSFNCGELGPVALLQDGTVLQRREWPGGVALGAALLELPLVAWPRVAWLTSHAGFDAALVDAAVAAGFDGLLLAGTGNGSLHADLQAAARRAEAAGVVVRLSTRCASGRLVGTAARLPWASGCSSAAQARVDLLLMLLQRFSACGGRPAKDPASR